MDNEKELARRIREFHEFQVKQLSDRPSYGLNGDIRISTLTKLLSTMTGYQLALIHEQYHLSNKSWWDQSFNGQMDQHDINIRTSSFNHLCLIGFFHGIFIALESSFRSISIALNPTRNNGGKAEFYNIYYFVFTSLNLEKYIPLFDILRTLRNTVHNNGLFIPKKGGDISFCYNNRTFEFKVDQLAPHLNQLDNSNLYYFLDQILICLKEVFNHPSILLIPKIEEKLHKVITIASI